jgi:AcrR family transcriptional regulator
MASSTIPSPLSAPSSGVPLAELPPRERILRTAHELFYREGIRATGVDRVIAAAGVAKLTFYRQFESKDALVRAFLDARHARWIAWFAGALDRHGGGPGAIVPALREWFASPDYRGCAFLNSVVELGPAQPEVAAVARAHKAAMTAVIAALLPAGPGRAARARAIALAVDGAIVQAQYLASPARALAALRVVLEALDAPPPAPARRAAARRLK